MEQETSREIVHLRIVWDRNEDLSRFNSRNVRNPHIWFIIAHVRCPHPHTILFMMRRL
jgi:hypothetical protein